MELGVQVQQSEKISSEARLAMQCDKDLIMSLLLLQNELIIESVSSHKVVKGFIQHIHAVSYVIVIMRLCRSMR